ncbi:ComEA family DNA-binding protein [Dermatobacter hominis]|uniref:ComEA family DNA-binding protein n=1 Tax=Dermatobacter hominis TaxID=2884263 RepID=UPI001D1110DC|nr:ComEA family DNA-binding protein [Dermatobacter hominis]UDY35768.1 helix-hairpin-helix domain-containing protein [Dermatobacter hominis]
MRDAAMDELARPDAPRTPWERVAELFPSRRERRGPGRGQEPGRGAGPRPWLPVAATVVAVLVGLAAWQLLRRPPDAAEALPRAASEPPASTALTPDDASPGGSTTTAGTGSGPGGGPVVVHVAGAVVRPGVVTLPAGSRAVDAVAAAGGLAPGADPDRVNLAAPVVDGERLAVPLVGQPPPAEVAPQVPAGSGAGAGTPGAGAPGAGAQGAGAPIDLNAADAQQLDSLPGVGPSTAQAIIAHRDEHGPFRSVEELLDVRGIGEAKLDALRDLVTVGGA